MAYEEGMLNKISAPAGSDMSGKLYYGVSLVADPSMPPGVHAALGNAGKAITGVLQNNPMPGQACTIMVYGTTPVAITPNNAITAGGQLDLDVGGTFIPHATGTAVAEAVEGAPASPNIQIISARLTPSNAGM